MNNLGVNDDGQQELLVSLKLDEGPYLVYVFYTRMERGGETARLLAQSYLGSAGGARISATLLPDKSVLDEQFSAFDGKGDAKILVLAKGTNEVVEQMSVPIEQGQTPYEELGVKQGDSYDLSTLDWRNFE